MTDRPATISTNAQLDEIRHLRDDRFGADERFRRELVRLMKNRGSLTVEQIGDAAGLSRVRLYQIVSEAEREER